MRALIEGDDEFPLAALAAIGTEIAAKRDDAKGARSSSGIETTWMEAEEAYLGIDEANRSEHNGLRWAKPMTTNAPLSTNSVSKERDHRSTAFVPLTARYVDAGAAKLGEILLPPDDKAFSFDAMPVPELTEASEDESQVVHDKLGVPLTRPLKPGEQPPMGMKPDAQGRIPLLVKDLALEKIEMAKKSAKAAETRVYDWMIQGGYRPEVRKVIHDSARIGVGILKAPTPKSKRARVIKTEAENIEVIFKETIIPAIEWKDPWNIFPDPACGENIHNGAYIFERDYMSARQVQGLKKLPHYIASQIDKVLEEGPNKSYSNSGDRRSSTERHKDRFEIWYFTGTLTRDEMNAIRSASGDDVTEDGPEQVSAIVTLINDSVVRATINPLDSGEFNYHSMPWRRRGGHWAGVGVAEQMRTAQRITNAATRAMLNNAGKSSDNQYIIDTTAIRPADGRWEVTPGKIWTPTKDVPDDVRKAFNAIQIPNTTEQLMSIIQMGERFAEETTSIPLVSQGQSGETTPDTFGATQLQNNNANQLLRSIGYAFDDFITEPVVRQFYEWLLLDSDVPNEEKREYQIDAHGSSALVERAIQDQFIGQIAGLVANPMYGNDPKKYMAELYRAHKMDPGRIQYSQEEQAKIDAAPPPVAPPVQVAQINADTQLKLGVMKQTTEAQSLQSEEQIAAAAQALEGHKTAVGATINLHELKMQHDRAMMEYANKNNISLAQTKTELATTAMKLQVEQNLNQVNQEVDLHKQARDHAVELYKHRTPPAPPPAVQVPGRAGKGRAASQAPAN